MIPTVKVFSGKPAELEAGFAPHLEGVFVTRKEAQTYAESWNDLYPSQNVVFWVHV